MTSHVLAPNMRRRQSYHLQNMYKYSERGTKFHQFGFLANESCLEPANLPNCTNSKRQLLSPITGRSCHKYHFCHAKTFVMTNMCLLQQTHVCYDKTRLLSRQKYACRDKHVFVVANIILSRQKLWHGKHTFVTTKDMFVVTKMILVSAPASDTHQLALLGMMSRTC